MVKRVQRFLAKSARQQMAALLATTRAAIGRASGAARLAGNRLAPPRVTEGDSDIYLACRPDSDTAFHAHPELAELGAAWTRDNESRNAGDLPRLYGLMLNIKQVLAEQVPGSFAELGVFKGNSAAVLAHYARRHGRTLWLFDTFGGFDRRDLTGIDARRGVEFVDTALDAVRARVGHAAVHYVQGYFPASVPPALGQERFSLIHLDCDLYEPIKAGLEFFYPRLSPGGMLIIHDYSSGFWEGVTRAVDEFTRTIVERPVLWSDKSGTAVIRRNARVDTPAMNME